MADKISVGKKKKIIAGAIAGAVVLTGAGVGLGVGLGGGEKLPDKLVEFFVEESGVKTVYTTTGEAVSVEDLIPGQKILFPTPENTFIGEGNSKQYFVGWSTVRGAAVPSYFVGDEIITVSNKTQSFHAIYMSASEELKFTNIDDETCSVAYDNSKIDAENRGGILVVPNEKDGRRVVGVTARVGAARQYELEGIIASNKTSAEDKAAAQEELDGIMAAAQNKASLKAVVIARGIEEIGDYAFYDCQNLENVSFVDDIYVVESGVEGQALTIEEKNVVTTIGAHAFENDVKLESVSIPNEVVSIGNSAFYKCSALASVTIEEGSKLESLGDDSFRGAGMTKLDFTGCESLTAIGARSFLGCPNVTEIGLPDNTYTTFGGEMFYNSTKLERISTDLTDPENFKMPTNIVGIVNGWFRNCQSLKKVELPKGITQLYCWAFADCFDIEEIIFHPDTILSGMSEYVAQDWATFSHSIFVNCTSLKELVIPEGWNYFGYNTFNGCTSLKSVSFPSTVVELGTKDFTGYSMNNNTWKPCASLETIIFRTDAEGKTAFKGFRHNTTYNFSGTALKYIKYTLPNSDEIDTTQPNTMPNNILVEGMFQGTKLESYVLPEGLTKIPAFAFASCKNLEAITIPDSVTEIGEDAFYYSGLKEIVIPENVTTLGHRAFAWIYNLEKITINAKNITSLGGDCFQGIYTEEYEDANANDQYDEGEEFIDYNGNGKWDAVISVLSNLKQITFGENVKSFAIGGNQFMRQNNILVIEFKGETVPTFTGIQKLTNPSTTIVVPTASLSAYQTAFDGYNVSDTNPLEAAQ